MQKRGGIVDLIIDRDYWIGQPSFIAEARPSNEWT